jgi:hypothetical protein
MSEALQGHSEHFFPQDGKYGEFQSGHSLYLQHSSGDYLAHMNWDANTGEVLTLRVKAPYRRQGVATHVWKRAHHLSAERGLTPPSHSDLRTDLGESWVQGLDRKHGSEMGN